MGIPLMLSDLAFYVAMFSGHNYHDVDATGEGYKWGLLGGGLREKGRAAEVWEVARKSSCSGVMEVVHDDYTAL